MLHTVNSIQYYGDNYKYFVQSITAPFRNNTLSNFMDLSKLSNNYFVNDNYTTFNRPVSEQCFITLCYNRIEVEGSACKT